MAFLVRISSLTLCSQEMLLLHGLQSPRERGSPGEADTEASLLGRESTYLCSPGLPGPHTVSGACLWEGEKRSGVKSIAAPLVTL